MNKKGFTLIELIAVIAILAIVMGITLVTTTTGFGKAKKKSENVFIGTVKDAINIYIDSSDAKKLNYSKMGCMITKTHGNVSVYKAEITINDIINSEYSPISQDDLVNPSDKDKTCNVGAKITIYRDDDMVYYYLMERNNLDCLSTCNDNDCKYITNLPDELVMKGCI